MPILPAPAHHTQAELFPTLPESLFWVWWESICENLVSKVSEWPGDLWSTRTANCCNVSPSHFLCPFCPAVSIWFLGVLTGFVFVLWVYPFLLVCLTCSHSLHFRNDLSLWSSANEYMFLVKRSVMTIWSPWAWVTAVSWHAVFPAVVCTYK